MARTSDTSQKVTFENILPLEAFAASLAKVREVVSVGCQMTLQMFSAAISRATDWADKPLCDTLNFCRHHATVHVSLALFKSCKKMFLPWCEMC